MNKSAVAVPEGKATVTFKVYPNPSRGSFMLQLSSNNIADKVTLRIANAVGRTVEVRSIPAGSTLRLSNGYPLGIYYVEAIQGREKVTRNW